MHEKQIYQTKTIPELTVVYKECVAKIDRAYRELEEVRNELDLAFAGRGFDVCLPSREYYTYKPIEVKERIVSEIKRKAWKHAYDKLGVRKVLSVKRMEEFDKIFSPRQQWDKDQLPEFTAENVFQMFSGLMNSANDFLQEAVIEVYEYLRPAMHNNWQNLKTNEKNAKYTLGKKVIIYALRTGKYAWLSGKVSVYHQNKIVAVDRVFHALDGKSSLDGYQSELVDAINTCEGTGETDYFKFKAYKNGNLHLEFRRLDLLQRLNQIAGCETELQG